MNNGPKSLKNHSNINIIRELLLDQDYCTQLMKSLGIFLTLRTKRKPDSDHHKTCTRKFEGNKTLKKSEITAFKSKMVLN